MFNIFRKSVATKVSLIISLMVVLTSLVVGSLFYISGNNILENQELDEVKHASKHIRHEIINFYTELLSMAQLVPKFESKGNLSETESFIKSFLNFNEKVIGVSLKTKNGGTLIKQGDLRAEKVESVDFTEYIFKGGEAYISNLIFVEEKEPTKENEGYFPVFLIKVNRKDLVYYISVKATLMFQRMNIITQDHMMTIIYDPSGKIIYHPNPQKRFTGAKTVKYSVLDEFQNSDLSQFISDKQDLFLTFEGNYRDQVNLMYTEKLFFQDKLISGILLAVTKDHLVTFKPALNLSNLLISLIFLVGFSYMGWLSTRYLLSNLNEITEQAQKYTQGEHDVNIEVKSQDEIGILALTFQGMVRQVNERTRILRKSERRIREARDQAEQALSSKSHLLEDLRKQKAEIERVSKDKDDLLAIVSHDLKNPLAVVETSMDIIIEDEGPRLSSTASDLIRRSKSSARIALNLITDLLDLSRLEGGIRLDFERFSVDEMIESVVDSFFLKSREKKITINLYKENNYDLIADYGRIIQILSNIIGNSLKFTPHEGTIDITIKEFKTTMSYEGTNKGLEIVVSDNGPGIPVDKLESIFDKFSQARKKDREIGTGLGLTICKNICELHNGDIYASSKPGEGATFTIRLPRLVLHEEIKEEGLNQSFTVMIVNDDEDFRKRARTALSNVNFQVLEAKNGEEMLKTLEGNQEINLIVLDEDMPVKNGVEALIEMTDKYNLSVPIIYISDKFNENLDPKYRANIVDMMTTEVEPEELGARVASILKPDSVASFEKKLDPSKRTILVVDDEEGIRLLLYENFIFLGYNCLFAKSGVEALFLVQKYHLDLVVSDIRMSEVDGLTLTKVLKKEFPKLPVILMSANIDNLSENLSEKLGIVKLYPKPFDIDDLNEFVRSVIGGAFLKEERSIVKKKKEKGQIKILPKVKEEVKRVLLVDDSEDMQTLFKVLLRKENLNLSIASNGKEALEIFQKEKFDTIFMDMNMPVMGGKEAIEKMRAFEKGKEKQDTYIVLLTADQYENDSELKRFGFSSYIQKPLSREKILKEINHANKS